MANLVAITISLFFKCLGSNQVEFSLGYALIIALLLSYFGRISNEDTKNYEIEANLAL